MLRLGRQRPHSLARFNSSTAGEPSKPTSFKVSKWGNVAIPTREELLKRRETYTPDLSYLKNASSSSVVGKLLRFKSPPPKPAAPQSQHKPLEGISQSSAKKRREERLARETAAANAREAVAAAALKKLTPNNPEQRSAYVHPKPVKIQNAVEEANQAIRTQKGMQKITDLSLIDVPLLSTVTPNPSAQEGRPTKPHAKLSTSEQKRRELRLAREEAARQSPSPNQQHSHSPMRRKKKRNYTANKDTTVESLPDLADLEDSEASEADIVLDEQDVDMLPFESSAEISNPLPASPRLIEVLRPSSKQPALVEDKTSTLHPISRRLVSSFTNRDYSPYVPSITATLPSGKKTLLSYAQGTLSHNPSISLQMRKQALEAIERVTNIRNK